MRTELTELSEHAEGGDPDAAPTAPVRRSPVQNHAVQGFEDFYRTCWPGAVRLACLLTQDRAVGEEIAQDAFLQLYRSWDRAERPEAYLRRTLVNGCHNWRRHAHVRRAKLPLLARPDRVDLAADDLADAVASLPFRQRAVIVLRYYEGRSEAEIAEALGCRQGTVKSLASRALGRLAKVVTR